jgi:glycosidase
MRLILDCAFNHTGDTHMAFVDARTRGPASPFWDWYEFKQRPLPERDFDPAAYYKCWWGFGTMPDLTTTRAAPAVARTACAT